MPKSIPSILSSTPPCPGKIFPVSFNFAFLLSNEKNKSPDWQPIEVKTLIMNVFKLKLPVKLNNKKDKTIKVNSIEPNAPEIVLFGLIVVSLGPLNIFPNIYPPISDAIHPIKSEKVITFN
tara:strand:+ start:1504 stop:1866 length:363 start_codon:yes stop_codon:yes gene_type:complete